MDRDLNQFVPQNGMSVIGADGEKVGEIDGVEQDYFVVRKGFFFPQDHYIPLTAISSYDDNQVYLNVTKDESLEQEWSNPPAAGTTYGETTTVGDQATIVDDRDAYVETDVDRGVDAGVRRDADDDATIELHEEELAARKRPVERGEVRIDKDVVAEQETLEVPVTEEEVEITRRPVDRDVNVGDDAFEEGTIEVPLRGEEVDVEKRARVAEEIDIDKTAKTRTERVSDTVRREEVDLGGENVDFDRENRERDI